jgi:hypothetical protein
MLSPTKLSPVDSMNTLKRELNESQATARSVDITSINFIEQKVSLDNDKGLQNGDDKQKAELMFSGSEQNMSTLQDLSNLLYTRGRLEELGCRFTTRGELVTYGHPANLGEFEQLLRLGPVYDEQWTSLFAETPPFVVDSAMWPDMRTLKRVLSNESVKFRSNHQRLTHGDGSDKMVRLCAAYDDLYKLWSASMSSRNSMTPIMEQEDSGCFVGNEGDQVDENRKVYLGKSNTAGDASQSQESLPRNIGWRFSDDLDANAAERESDTSEGESWRQLARDLGAAMTAHLPDPSGPRPSADTLRSPPSTPRARAGSFFRPIKQARLWHGSSPLRVRDVLSQKFGMEGSAHEENASTADPILRDEPLVSPLVQAADPHLPDDEMVVARRSTADTEGSVEIKGLKKKGLKGWWIGVLDRLTPPPGAAVGALGGWS